MPAKSFTSDGLFRNLSERELFRLYYYMIIHVCILLLECPVSTTYSLRTDTQITFSLHSLHSNILVGCLNPNTFACFFLIILTIDNGSI